MTAQSYAPDHVHFVGSIGLDSVEEVFHTIGPRFGRRLRRIPDGEPGGRRGWIHWQYPLLRNSPFLVADTDVPPTPLGAPKFRLADGVEPGELRFGELGYAREARASYLDLCAARDHGEVAEGVRLQVGMPTPFAVIYVFCSPRDVVEIERAYEAAMIREVEALCRAIPHRDLCIQWEVCTEMVHLDGQLPPRFSPEHTSKADIMARMRRLTDPIPPDVEVGFHLCYGDMDAQHMVEPRDAGKLVEVANALAEAVVRPITYIHMPVPVDRSDDAYFAPLARLKLDKDTELYLGLIHASDGVEGTRKRIATAAKYIKGFGVASECGIARARASDLVHRFIDVYDGVTVSPD